MSFWIFQGNPEKYRIAHALREVSQHDYRMTWSVRQHIEEVHVGDQVYLWQSGPHGGVCAVAVVKTEPAEIPNEPWELRFCVVEPKVEDQVKLLVTEILPVPLPRTQVKAEPAISGNRIFRFAAETNFSVTADEAAALDRLIVEWCDRVEIGIETGPHTRASGPESSRLHRR